MCSASDYFKRAFQSEGFKERKTGHLEWEDCDRHVFDAFIAWLKAGGKEDRFTIRVSRFAKIRTWCFAERYMIRRLQNAVMKDLLMSYLDPHDVIKPAPRKYVRDHCAEDSPLRRLMDILAEPFEPPGCPSNANWMKTSILNSDKIDSHDSSTWPSDFGRYICLISFPEFLVPLDGNQNPPVRSNVQAWHVSVSHRW